MELPKLLVATCDGRVLEHPTLRALVRSGEEILLPSEAPRSLPAHAKLVHLPGRLPVGLDPATGRAQVVERMAVGRKRVAVQAVAAVLPPGYTRTFLPAYAVGEGPVLPQWAYTAAGYGPKGPVAWALRTETRRHWDPSRFNLKELARIVRERLEESPDNRVLAQLSKCALEYRCFTSQNTFYCRDEGALPSSTGCNARCLGCISESRKGGPPSSMSRIERAPTAEELAEVGAWHLRRASGRVMVSFGQGCEGEPLTRGPVLVEAVARMRRMTDRGSININTNASRPQVLEGMFRAGLDAIRVSLNSAHPELYGAYYRPVGYGLEEVEESIRLARQAKAYVALNLLMMPGVTDREGEVACLESLIVRHRVNQVQTRSLAIDAEQYLALAKGKGAGGEPMGISSMLRRLKAQAPWLVIGNFARGLGER